jgi:hypothetical protein
MIRSHVFWKIAVGVCIFLTAGSVTGRAQNASTSPVSVSGYSPTSSDSSTPEAETGTVEAGWYSNSYFEVTYPLLPEWREDFKGPLPSNTGYYVLSALRPKGELNGTVLVAAQDLFFTLRPVNNSLELLTQMEQRATLSQLKIDGSPRELKIGESLFARLDYSGAGLHHAVFATEIRCHVVTVEITTRDLGLLEQLTGQVNDMVLPPAAIAKTGGGEFPLCVKGYASGANLIHYVEPAQVGPKFTRVPVRIIIDKQGKIKHIHVINAFPDQAKSVIEALAQWTFKPYIQDGQPESVETGILFEFGVQKRNANEVKVAMPVAGWRKASPKELP